MEELFDTFNETGEFAGRKPRSQVHRQGLWHKAANVLLFRTDGRLIVQRRHKLKDVWPDVWDLSVAEHLQSGESHIDGALRGINEELGISDVALQPITAEYRRKLEVTESGIKDWEIQMAFHGVTDAEITPQAEEVSAIRLFTLADLQQAMTQSPTEFTPWFRELAQSTGLIEAL